MSWKWYDFVWAPWTVTKFVWEKLVPKTPAMPQIPGRPAQVAAFGKSLPVVFGKTRITGGLLYLSDEYRATLPAMPYGTWTATGRDVIIALCEGEITGIGLYWWDKFASDFTMRTSYWNATLKTGTLAQTAWTVPPVAKRLAYPGVAHIGMFVESDSLGMLPQMSYEVKGLRYASGDATNGDADPAYVVSDLLTNTTYGAAASFTVDVDLGQNPGTGGVAAASYRRYAAAEGLWISPAYADPRPVVQHLEDTLSATNSTALWTEGTLKIVPLGDTAVTGGGVTYTPEATVQYALTSDDLLGPIEVELAADADIFNVAPVEYMERKPLSADTDPAHSYNVAVVEDPDPVDQATRGERRAATAQMSMICQPSIALKIARIRAQTMVHARNTYRFDLPWRFARLEPLDFVTLTDSRLGLSAVTVRIHSITESDGVLHIEAVDAAQGAGYAKEHAVSGSDGASAWFSGDGVQQAAHSLAMKNWNARTIPSGGWRAVAWNGTVFSAVSDDGKAATSPDGITWTARTMAAGVELGALAWSGTLFCGVGGSGVLQCATSPDGITWTERTIPAGGGAGAALKAVAWNGSVFCTVGYGATGYCATSSDGITWTARTIPDGQYRAVAWNGTVFAAVGLSGVCSTSPDGITWTARSALPNTRSYWALASGNSMFCAVHNDVNDTCATSPDGITWTERSMPTISGGTRARTAIAWTGAVFVAVEVSAGTTASACYVSPDGINWTSVANGMPGASVGYYGITFNGQSAVAVGYSIAAQSLIL